MKFNLVGQIRSAQLSFRYHQNFRVMRKPAFCTCKNKSADQLCSNRTANQRLCFRYIDSTIPLLPKSETSSPCSSSVVAQPGLCWTWSKTPKTGFSHVVAQMSSLSSLLLSPTIGLAPVKLMGIYCSSKSALAMMSETLRYELKDWGISVSTVVPSGYRTGKSVSLSYYRSSHGETYGHLL